MEKGYKILSDVGGKEIIYTFTGETRPGSVQPGEEYKFVSESETLTAWLPTLMIKYMRIDYLEKVLSDGFYLIYEHNVLGGNAQISDGPKDWFNHIHYTYNNDKWSAISIQVSKLV